MFDSPIVCDQCRNPVLTEICDTGTYGCQTFLDNLETNQPIEWATAGTEEIFQSSLDEHQFGPRDIDS